MSDDRPYAGRIVLHNVRLTFPSLYKRESVPMIDKSKPFYLVRTANAFTGLARPPGSNGYQNCETPELYRAVQDLETAKGMALQAVTDGTKPSLDVYEVRLIGRVGPPAPQWQPVKQPRKPRRKAARHRGR